MTDDAPKPGLIHEAILAAMAEVGNIPKEERNEFQKYNFRGIDKVYNRVYPIFCKHGIFTTSKVLLGEHKVVAGKDGKSNYVSYVQMQYTFHAKDGSFVTTEVVAEGQDSSDKASNKANSAAHKYALFQILMIPVAAVDSDRELKDNPDEDPGRKKPPSRAQRPEFGISETQLKILRTKYRDKNKDLDNDTLGANFTAWVTNVNGGVAFDRNDLSLWPRETYTKCLAELDNN